MVGVAVEGGVEGDDSLCLIEGRTVIVFIFGEMEKLSAGVVVVIEEGKVVPLLPPPLLDRKLGTDALRCRRPFQLVRIRWKFCVQGKV